jgi:uncharacterized RDD family membrane protein YckC
MLESLPLANDRDHPPVLTDQQSAPNILGGFWRRVAAFALDGLILGAVGWAAASILEHQLVLLGPWGRLVGFAIAWPYFGLLNSQVGGGHTLGKQALGIKVVTSDGRLLSMSRAFARFLPLGAAWFLNGVQSPAFAVTSPLSHVGSVAVFGVGLAMLYLLVFNRASGQSLHDLLVGSHVVLAKGHHNEPIKVPPTWPVHLAVCGVLIIGSAFVPQYAHHAVGKQFWLPVHSIEEAVSAISWVDHAQVYKVQTQVSTPDKGKARIAYLSVVAFIKDADVENADRARQLAKLALAADPQAHRLDTIEVQLVYGYDIGIAESWRGQNHSHAPAEWLAR